MSYKIADLEQVQQESIKNLEGLISKDFGKPIILIAYEPEEVSQPVKQISPQIPEGYITSIVGENNEVTP